MKLLELPRKASYKADGSRLVKETTTAAYKSAVNSLESYLVKVLGMRRPQVEDLTPQLVLNWHEWLKKRRDISVRSANSYRRSLITIFRRLGHDNLVSQISQMSEPARKKKVAKSKYIDRILYYASVRDASMITLLRDSGIRRGAIPEIRHEDVLVWEGKEKDLRMMVTTHQKGDTVVVAFAGHECALLYNAWKSIQVLICETEYVFTTEDGNPLESGTINTILDKLKRSANLPSSAAVNPHAFRHRFAHKMLDEYDAKIVSQWMGHSNVTTTLDIYGERDLEELKEAYFQKEKGRERL